AQVPAAGLYSSALAGVPGPEPAPATSTLPLASSVAVPPVCGLLMPPVAEKVPEVAAAAGAAERPAASARVASGRMAASHGRPRLRRAAAGQRLASGMFIKGLIPLSPWISRSGGSLVFRLPSLGTHGRPGNGEIPTLARGVSGALAAWQHERAGAQGTRTILPRMWPGSRRRYASRTSASGKTAAIGTSSWPAAISPASSASTLAL